MADVNSIYKHPNATHGMSRGPEYRVWCRMLRRCRSPRDKSYKHYGGRGITVCERWRQFENFYSDMGARPSNEHSIDRIDNNGNYEPGNCRWATKREQNRNTRRSVFVEFNGRRLTLVEWAETIGVKYWTLVRRVEAHGLPQALAIPAPPPARRDGLRRGADVHTAILKEEDVPIIRQRSARGEDSAALATEYGVKPYVIQRAVRRATWKHLP